MPLTYEQRVELLAKAREAKKAKQLAGKPAPTPTIPVVDSDTSSEDIEEPVKPTKTKIPNPKWLKNPDIPKKVKVEGKMSKEQYVIDDEPEPEPAPAPPVKAKKPRKPKEPVNSLDIVVKPKEIEEVMEDVVANDTKYKPKVKAAPPKKAPQIVISRPVSSLNLFDY